VDNLLRNLARLVAYKIREIHILENEDNDAASWDRLEILLNRESHYLESVEERSKLNSYQKAMLSYYEFLENRFLSLVFRLKSNASCQISQAQVKRSFTQGKK